MTTLLDPNKVSIISEIGINWSSPEFLYRGDFNMALALVEQAAKFSTFVKFQLYDPDKVFPPDLDEDGNDKNERLREEAYGFRLTKADWVFLCRHIYNCGAIPLASVFDEERLRWCEELENPVYKIASRTVAEDPELCNKIIATGKPVICSLGMWQGPEDSRPFGTEKQVHYLECVSKYPAQSEDMANLSYEYGDGKRYAGLSDHSIGYEACIYAIGRGAYIIEKHYTWKVNQPGSDHRGSMDEGMLNRIHKSSKFAEMVRAKRRLSS